LFAGGVSVEGLVAAAPELLGKASTSARTHWWSALLMYATIPPAREPGTRATLRRPFTHILTSRSDDRGRPRPTTCRTGTIGCGKMVNGTPSTLSDDGNGRSFLNADNGEGAAKIAVTLNILLADMFSLYFKTKNFHWHMTGPHFRDYHLLLDEQAK